MPPPPGGAAQGALRSLRAGGVATPAAAAAPAAAAVVTGTGFFAGERAAVRELARLAGVQYSGDLVAGRTTHLVVAPGGGTASRKLQKAAEWGIPALRLQWLLDSIVAGALQPAHPYLIDFDECEEELQAPPAAAPVGAAQAAAAAPSCRELPLRDSPSSVGSNPLQAAHQAAAGAACGGCASGSGPAVGPGPQQQQQQQSAGRPALAPVANVLADQLRRMSISPEPWPAQQQDQPHRHRQQHPQPSDSPLQHRSPSWSAGSPQRSLSLQGMVAAPARSPAEADSGAHAAAGCERWPEEDGGSPGTDAGGQREQGWSPMQESSAGYSPQQQQPGSRQQPGSQQRPSQPRAADWPVEQSPGSNGMPPFAFPVAGVLARSVSDEMAHGSPMAESPAAPVLGMQGAGIASAGRATSGGSRLCGARAASPAPSSMAGTPAGAGSQGDPLCTLPTPACIRDWSDDDSSLGGSPPAAAAAQQGADGDGRTGLTQTPPAVRQAIAAAMGPTQVLPPRQQQQQQQQQQVAEGSPQLAHTAEADLSDGETVAPEPPAAGELVVSDSGSDEELAPCSRPQHAQEQQDRQQQGDASPAAAVPVQQQHPQQAPPVAQQAQQQPTSQKRQGLLQISRVGQPHAPSSRWPPAPTEQEQQHAVGPAAELAATAAYSDGEAPLLSAGGGEWEPREQASCRSGHGDTSPAGPGSMAGASSPNLPAGHHGEQCPAASGSAAGPAADESCITSRRPGGGAGRQQPAAAAARRSVRDWSESDCSGDEFPTPTGRRGKGGLGLTGLTQLDPASIVIARPKPNGAGSALVRRGADQGGIVGRKFLQRPPRGNAVREHHGLPNLKTVQFAEQVQVTALSLLLSTKDKKTAVRLRPGGLTEEEAEDHEFRPSSSAGSRGRRSSASSAARGGSGAGAAEAVGEAEEEPVLAEPQTFYRLANGGWHFELCRFYTAAQAEAAAAAAGRTLALPQGFDRSCELLRALEREHAPMSDIAGGIQIRRVKQGGSMLRLRGGTASGAGSKSYFWRRAIDTACWRVVTDQAAADFVAIE